MASVKKTKKISDIFNDYHYAFQIKSQLEREIEFNQRRSSIKVTSNDSIKSTKPLKMDDKYNNFIAKNERYFKRIDACQLYIDKVELALEFLKERNERVYNVVYQRYINQDNVNKIIQENKIGKSTYWLWLGKAEEILNNAMLLDEKWTEIGL